MNFINDNEYRKFRELGGRGTLYIYGYTNIEDKVILDMMDRDDFPYDVRGQFAFVYIRGDKWVGVVDHISSTQLFYSDDHISSSLVSVKEATKITPNKLTYNIRKFMTEYVPGTITPYNEISRVDFESYVECGKQKRYMDICNEPIREFNVEEMYDLSVKAALRQPDVTLLFSGGKDSAYLAMLYKHLGLSARLLHITSPNRKHTADDDACELYIKEKRWRVLKHKIQFSGPQTVEDKELYCRRDYWHDNTHPPKSFCGQKWPNMKITGEITVTDHQRRTFGSVFVNMGDKVTPELIVTLYLRHCFNSCSKLIPYSMDDTLFNTYKKNYPEEFRYLWHHYLDKIHSIDKPFTYAYYLFAIQCLSSHRIYAQSQDTNAAWYSPFADYDLYNYMLNLSWKGRESGDIQKAQLYNTAKEKFGEHFTDIPWRFPVMGMGINVQ